jgi:L-lysine exporter family protein LysE/ArgO
MTIGISAFHLGLAMGTASIISVGPNNLMLLREGMVRGRIMTVASLVLVSYVALVTAAMLNGSSSFRFGEGLPILLSWCGLVALLYFAAMSFQAVWRHEVADSIASRRETLFDCICRVMRVVWANPLTWLELLLVPAALVQSFPTDADRVSFARHVGHLLLWLLLVRKRPNVACGLPKQPETVRSGIRRDPVFHVDFARKRACLRMNIPSRRQIPSPTWPL